MNDPRDIASFTVGVTTAGIGGMTLAQVQSLMGIIAALAGIALTVITYVWRRKEHKRRMEKLESERKRSCR